MNKDMSNDEYLEFLNIINTLPKKEYEIIRRGVLQLNDDKKELFNEISRLNNIINTILGSSIIREVCPLNLGFTDKLEDKAQDVFYEDDEINYCENCNDDFKKCWLKYFEKLKELKDNSDLPTN